MRKLARKLKVVSLLIAVIAISAATTGCQKSKKTNTPNALPNTPATNQQIVDQLVSPGGDCPGCLNQPEFLMAGLGKYSGTDGNLEIALDFYGEKSLGADKDNAASACAYRGPVVGIGNFHIVNSTPHMCGLEVGKYQVMTSRKGTITGGPGVGNMGGIQRLVVFGRHEASGRTVEVELTNSIINGTCDVDKVRAQGIDGSFRFGIDNLVTIRSVNGQSCNNDFILFTPKI